MVELATEQTLMTEELLEKLDEDGSVDLEDW